MGRPYTGFDGNAAGRRPGTEKLVQLLAAQFKNGIWNNGTWAVRAMKNANNPGKPSVHGTGRAADMSWRRQGENKGFGRYELVLPVFDFLTAHAEILLIEEIHDYFPQPFGRGWRCDRSAWKVYDKPTIGSAPGGDWVHFEIAPAHADDPGYYDEAFKRINSGQAIPAPAVAPAPVAQAAKPATGTALKLDYPGTPLKAGSKGDAVKLVQAVVGTPTDGDFGAKTTAAVKNWQKAKGLKPSDGVVGPTTWKAMFG